MKKCLIFYEEASYSEDLLEAARQMYGDTCNCYGLYLNPPDLIKAKVFDALIVVNDQRIKNYDVKNITNILEELQKKYDYDAILIPASHFGRMLAPHLAMRLHVGLVADITAVKKHSDGLIEMIRPAFDGKILAGIKNNQKKPLMMSVRPGIFIDEKRIEKPQKIIDYQFKNFEKPRIKQIKCDEKPKTRDIRESNILVSGGGGIISDFDKLDALADALGGMKAASRRIIDENMADRSIQVGQSGKIVNPDLYLALGIYGALQHVAGLNRVKHLIAVNTNGKAPICSMADIVVEGDAADFAEKLTKRIIDGPQCSENKNKEKGV